MSLLIVIGIYLVWCISTLIDELTPPAPIVKDWDKFRKDSEGKSPREIRRMIRSGKY